MEFPTLGEHCSDVSCKQLDFLPMKCDACLKLFCKDHITYTTHSCEAAYKKNIQVPVCPLCNKPVPINKGELPDIKVGQHIDLDCQSDPAKEKRKAYTNKCSLKGCKQKELVKVTCETCQLNYCIKHRHPQDHQCQGFQKSGRGVSRAGAAAVNRFEQLQNRGKPTDKRKAGGVTCSSSAAVTPTPRAQPVSQGQSVAAHGIQGSMSEDEALARVLQMSLTEQQQGQNRAQAQPVSGGTSQQQQEDDDWALAQAIAASEQEQTGRVRDQARQTPQKQKSCTVT